MLPLLVRQISYICSEWQPTVLSFRFHHQSFVYVTKPPKSTSIMCLLHPFSTKKLCFFPNCFHLYLQKWNQEAHCGLPTSFRHLHTPCLPTIIIFKQVFIPLIVPHGTFTAIKAIIWSSAGSKSRQLGHNRRFGESQLSL